MGDDNKEPLHADSPVGAQAIWRREWLLLAVFLLLLLLFVFADFIYPFDPLRTY